MKSIKLFGNYSKSYFETYKSFLNGKAMDLECLILKKSWVI